jgi:hypothetical protein
LIPQKPVRAAGFCYRRGESGDVIDFVRCIDNLTCPDAVARVTGGATDRAPEIRASYVGAIHRQGRHSAARMGVDMSTSTGFASTGAAWSVRSTADEKSGRINGWLFEGTLYRHVKAAAVT